MHHPLHAVATRLSLDPCGRAAHSALTISSVIFLASPNSIMVLSR
jgi:hypothetical protein